MKIIESDIPVYLGAVVVLSRNCVDDVLGRSQVHVFLALLHLILVKDIFLVPVFLQAVVLFLECR